MNAASYMLPGTPPIPPSFHLLHQEVALLTAPLLFSVFSFTRCPVSTSCFTGVLHVCLGYLPVLLEHSPFPSPSCSKLSLFSSFFPTVPLAPPPTPHPQCHRFHMAPACDMKLSQNTPDALFNPPLFQPLLNFKQNKRREGGDGGV